MTFSLPKRELRAVLRLFGGIVDQAGREGVLQDLSTDLPLPADETEGSDA